MVLCCACSSSSPWWATRRVSDALPLDHVGQDLGYGQVLVDAPIGAQRGAGQGGFYDQPVARASNAGVGLHELGDDAVYMAHRMLPAPNREKRGLVQQRAEINGGVDAGQFEAKPIGLGQRFVQREFNDVKRRAAGGGEGEAIDVRAQ